MNGTFNQLLTPLPNGAQSYTAIDAYHRISQTSRRVKTYTNAAAMARATAIKLSVASSTSATFYVTTALDGAIGQGAIDFTQSVTVTTTTAVGAYSIASPITITGTNGQGSVTTGTITLTATGGNETVHALDTNGYMVGFASVTRIDIPAQALTSGAFTFGVGHVVLDSLTFDVRAGAVGNLVLGFPGGTTDTTPAELGEHYYTAARVVYSTSTAYPISIGV